MSPAPGQKLGPYEILAFLGAGAMGEVWKARDTRLNRLVAIKRLTHGELQRFAQEARAIAALSHPNICQIHDIGPDYLVLEYIDGMPLRGPMEVPEAVRLAIQIAEALNEAHRRGIVHRDLKPANILITNRGSAKLLDFGIARVSTDETSDATRTEEGTLLGTPAYMAPEQLAGKVADERSDIFAFGAVLYEILTGERPFRGDSAAEVISAILRDNPAPLNAPSVLESIVLRCIAKKPCDRYQTMAEVCAALRDASIRPASHGASSPMPMPPRQLIGRERELAELRGLLADPGVRLISLTGPGGVGKTRLAIELARQARQTNEDVWFIELEGISEPDRLASAILHGLGLQEEDARPPEFCIFEHLGSRRGLLVLDNFEQLMQAARFVARLLAACPRLVALVTSREVLRLRAEREYTVEPLAVDTRLPPAELIDSAPVALFLEYSGIARPAPDTVRSIAEICAHLDGLPLAIELAAARSKILSPQDMLARLRNRLQWLRGGPRDLPRRQQTLRDAIDWSFDLLSEGEKRLIQRLSVFSGGATVQAVESVCGEPDAALELLAALAEKSLLLKQDPNKSMRVRMLETIREYARERLDEAGESDEVRARHAAYYLALAEASGGQEGGSARAAWCDALEEEQGNCAAAFDFLLERGEAESALRMAGALWPFWDARGYWTEGRQHLKRVLSQTAGQPFQSARAQALYGAGVLADAQGDYNTARKMFEEHLAIQRGTSNPAAIAAAVNNLGITALRQGDYDAARAAYVESLELLRSLDSQIAIAQCLNNLGHVAMAQGQCAVARRHYEESLAICRRERSLRDTAWTLTNLADVAREQCRYEDAELMYSQSLGLFRQIEDTSGMANCMADLGNLRAVCEQHGAAAQLYQEALVIFGEMGDTQGITRVLDGFAMIASARGQSEVALRLAAAVQSARHSLGLQRSRVQARRVDASVASAKAALGSDAERVWRQGEQLPLQEAIEEALRTAALW